jgi:hypothetical protein
MDGLGSNGVLEKDPERSLELSQSRDRSTCCAYQHTDQVGICGRICGSTSEDLIGLKVCRHDDPV